MLQNKYGHLIELVGTTAQITSAVTLPYNPTYAFTLFIEKPALGKIAHVKGPPSSYENILPTRQHNYTNRLRIYYCYSWNSRNVVNFYYTVTQTHIN